MKSKAIIQQFIKFSIVGIANTGLDFAILNFLHLILHLNLYLSGTISVSVAIINSYYFNSIWSFKDTKSNKNHKKQFTQFIFISLIALCLTNGIMYTFTEFARLNYNISKAIATVIVVFFNFTANKLWTFKSSLSIPEKK